MPLASLATTDDVAVIVGRALTTLEVTNATRLLQMASGMVRRYTRQTLTAVAADTITLPAVWGQTVTLPERPVTNVASVTLNGAVMPYTQYKVIGDDLFIGTGSFMPDYGSSLFGGEALWGPAGSGSGPQATGATWQGPQAQIVVVYDHGYATVPDDVVNEVAGMAALQISSPVGINSEMIGGYKVGYARSPVGGMSLTDETKSVLNSYRKRSASVSIATRR